MLWQRLVVAVYSRTPERPRRAVVRLATPSYRVGVLAVVTRPDGRVLLVDPPYLTGWGLPGGDVKRGESVPQALARELREEVGLHVDVGPVTEAVQRVHDRWVTFVTRVEITDEVADTLSARSPELSRVGWFAPDALPEIDHDAQPPLDIGLRRAGQTSGQPRG